MASSQRVPAIFSHLISKSRPSPYVCRSCRQQLQIASKPNAQQVRYATTPFTEKLRRRIWGTDNPPGLADPYGPGYAERRKMALEDQAERERRAQLTVDERIQEDATRQKQETELSQDRPNLVDRDFDQPFEDDPEMEEPVAEQEGYKPAETWDGLQHVGHRGNWRDMAPRPGDHYEPWLSQRPESPWSRQELVQFLQQAIAQSLAPSTLKNVTKRFLRTEDFSIYSVLLGPDGRFAGIEKRPEPRNTSRRPIPTNLDAALEDQHAQSGAEAASAAPEEAVLEDDITDTEVEKIVGGFPASSQNLQDVPEDVTLDPNGPTSFEAEVTDAEAEKIVQEIAAASPILQDSTLQESAETVSTESFPIEEAEAPVDEAFLAAKLDFADPLTFKILKSFQRLSSLRLPDPVLNSIFKSTATDSSTEPPLTKLINHILEDQKPKPKNLYERLMEKQHLTGQSNLMILPRRETPVDKEKEVGRWKVIEKELIDRGLPVLGRIQAQQ